MTPEEFKNYQSQRIEALELENARLQNLLDESRTILSQLLKEMQDANRLETI